MVVEQKHPLAQPIAAAHGELKVRLRWETEKP